MAQEFEDVRRIILDGPVQDRFDLIRRLDAKEFPDQPRLAEWLRSFLELNLAHGPHKTGAHWIRDQREIPAIRSWALSALVWSRSEDRDIQATLLRYLAPAVEPEASNRFWVLAGLLHSEAPILDEALKVTMGDPDPQVSLLARVVMGWDDPELIRNLRANLASKDFRDAWPVLRLLRVFPIPELAEFVVRQLGQRRSEGEYWDYDGLLALSPPPMAAAAQRHLAKRPGLDRLAELVLEQASLASRGAAESMGFVLRAFEREAATRAVNIAADRLAVSREIRRRVLAGLGDSGPEGDSARSFAGYASDEIDLSRDHLGIGREVETLAALMISKKIKPPLAIGLFGAWGSGKSYFMGALRAQAKSISKDARDTSDDRFCKGLVQIEFNAWHYSDANLWASLVSHILDRLSAHVDPKPAPGEERESLNRQLSSAKGAVAAAEAEQSRATEAVDQAQDRLAELRVAREQRQVRLRELRASDLTQLLTDNPTVKTELQAVLEGVGAPAIVDNAAELNRLVSESFTTGGRIAALASTLFTGKNLLWFVGCGIVVFAAAPAAGALADFLLEGAGKERFILLAGISSQLAAILASATVLLTKGVRQAQSALTALTKTKERVDKMLAEKRAEPTDEEKILVKEIAAAQAQEEAVKERLATASAKAVEIERRLADLRNSQSLAHFLAERTGSDDYRRHLGIVSTVRRDFESLVERLTTAEEGEKKVERIVLYIDDLDRCPGAMVVEVLQAVHLLLAFPLFVVVVSVDPRWLLRSLQERYIQFSADGEEPSPLSSASPQDYLEKIFQIPFSVPPMNEGAFEALMERLLGDDMAPAEQHDETSAAFSRDARTAPEDPVDPDDRVAETVAAASGATAEGKSSSDEAGGTETELRASSGSSAIGLRLERLAEALQIQPAERQFAAQLYPFIPTPRAAKRFSNTYRLLKASVRTDRLAAFEGANDHPGEFRLPMLLLALLVGNPGAAAILFPRILKNAHARSGRNWELPAGPADGWIDPVLARRVNEIASIPGFPASSAQLLEWLPKVARFSFGTAAVAAKSPAATERSA